MAVQPDSWTLDDLRVHLQAAVELELLVIPPYLCALYSLRPGANEEAALIVRSVVVEEMLHMIMAANVLNAVGGRPELGRRAWAPRYPAKIPYHRGTFEVGLLPFGDDALDAFLTIEHPSYPLAEPAQPSRTAAVPRLVTLAEDDAYDDYRTIGEFYDATAAALRSLVERLGPEAVFCGDPRRQIGPEHYYAGGGAAIRVCDLPSALAAIEVVVEQGEGELTVPAPGEKFDPARDLAHFYRFDELRRRCRYRAGDAPGHPTGEKIVLGGVYPMKPNLRMAEVGSPELRRAIEACNAIWSRLLAQIDAALNGLPEELLRAVGTMFALKHAACELLRIPLPGDADGHHAGPTFELVPGS